jgi:hypothetical protein
MFECARDDLQGDLPLTCTAGEVHLFINDNYLPTNISRLNSHAGNYKTVPVELSLIPGDVNSITFGVTGAAGLSSSK